MLFIQKYVNFKIFLASFIVGLIFIYFWGNEKKTVEVLPTPENINKYIFKDAADNCYLYTATETPCK